MTAIMIITGVLATIFMVIATMVLMAVVALTDIDDRRKELQEKVRNRCVKELSSLNRTSR